MEPGAYISVGETVYRTTWTRFDKLFNVLWLEDSFLSGTHINSRLVDFNGRLFYVFDKYIPELKRRGQMMMMEEKDPAVDTEQPIDIVTSLNELTINEELPAAATAPSLPIIREDDTSQAEEGLQKTGLDKKKLKKKVSSKEMSMDSVSNLCCGFWRTSSDCDDKSGDDKQQKENKKSRHDKRHETRKRRRQNQRDKKKAKKKDKIEEFV